MLVKRYRNGQYFYLTVKRGGKRIDLYLGSGQRAVQAAVEHAARQRARKAEREVRRAEREWWQTFDAQFAELNTTIESVLAHLLTVGGCRCHHGQWRKQRMNNEERKTAEAKVAAAFAALARGDPPWDRIAREAFEQCPEEFDGRYGDLAAKVIEPTLDRLVGQHAFERAGLVRRLDQLKAELAGEDPDPLTRILAERAAVTWLLSYEADITSLKFDPFAGSPSAAYFSQRAARLHRSFTSAVKAIAAVKKLLKPPMHPLDYAFGRNRRSAIAVDRN